MQPPKGRPVLLVGTRKGAFLFYGDDARKSWKLDGPHFLGNLVQHLVLDPRDGKTILMAASAGHLGPTVFRSSDRGKSWKEAAQPPAFPKMPEGEKGRSVKKVFWLTPGHASQPGTWFAGTSPEGLFRTDDGGNTWSPVSGLNDHPMLATWIGEGGTPDGVFTHSILVDPRDANHMYLSFSTAGTFESFDGGGDWMPLNRGVATDFIPGPAPEYGQDPHCVVLAPSNSDRLYQQNHCGIYRLDRPGDRWVRIGDNMPRKIKDIGFPIVVHPRHADTAWVFPMDGSDVWPRTCIEGKPAAYRTQNGGKSWQRQDKGFPRANAWWTVKRQAMCGDWHEPFGLYFGTTQGELWVSRNEGESWAMIQSGLPEIWSVSFGYLR
ncbi:MAG: glycosyl hydrolase [Candidatus Eisenbacteria bacterium]|nr:glycosyl hydrolase [Candidatus Eisenbacteria bacterium]